MASLLKKILSEQTDSTQTNKPTNQTTNPIKQIPYWGLHHHYPTQEICCLLPHSKRSVTRLDHTPCESIPILPPYFVTNHFNTHDPPTYEVSLPFRLANQNACITVTTWATYFMNLIPLNIIMSGENYILWHSHYAISFITLLPTFLLT
jgi:hypothetical protein